MTTFIVNHQGSTTLTDSAENDGATGLYYNRARYYRPEWGRFISADPIGFEGGLNQYVYAYNNPLAWTDPLGEKPTRAQRFIQGLKLAVELWFGVMGGVSGQGTTGREWTRPTPPPASVQTQGPSGGSGPSGGGTGTGSTGGRGTGSGGALGAVGTIAEGAGVAAEGIREVVNYRRKVEGYLDYENQP